MKPEAARIAAKQREAQQRGSTYKPTAEEQSLMSRTGGLGKPAGVYLAYQRLFITPFW